MKLLVTQDSQGDRTARIQGIYDTDVEVNQAIETICKILFEDEESGSLVRYTPTTGFSEHKGQLIAFKYIDSGEEVLPEGLDNGIMPDILFQVLTLRFNQIIDIETI